MRSRQSSLQEEWREVRGWVPWLIAGVYFPLYVALDYVAGGVLAGMVWLPRSVSVALCSLAVALLVAGVVIARRLDSVSPSTLLEEADPRTRAQSGGGSTVGSSGGVNRRTVETSVHEASAGGGERRSASRETRQSTRDGGTDGSGTAATEVTDDSAATDSSEEEWPDEWIPGDEV